MLISRRARRAVLTSIAALALNAATASAATKPTVVLVHGAFADGSSWSQEAVSLQARGYRVVVPANPLRGISADAEALRRVLTKIQGPIVLVGHSYGGATITNAATGNSIVKALVYVAAFAPDAGETLASLGQAHPGGQIGPPTLDLTPFTAPDGTQSAEGTVKAKVFPSIFAADVRPAVARLMAAAQRPAALATLTEASGAPAWKSIPSWFLVAGQDKAIGTELERFEAKRMHATTIVVKGASHAVLVSRPSPTTQIILAAARS